MTKNKLITLSNSEKCWLLIGVLLGIIITIVILYVSIHLPEITEIQKNSIVSFILGASIVWALQKASNAPSIFEEIDDEE